LRSRKFADALISDPIEAAEQALWITRTRAVIANDGKEIPVSAQTICIHGDSPGASEIAATVARHLRYAGIVVRAVHAS
jgi:UPF0271 protein